MSLSSNSRSIIYEFSKEENIFLPLQEITSADKIVSIVKNDAALLILAKNHSLRAYQFDGWRFARMSFEMEGVKMIKIVNYQELEVALVKKDDGTWSLNRFVAYFVYLGIKHFFLTLLSLFLLICCNTRLYLEFLKLF